VKERERRAVATTVELRKASEDAPPSISGYAAMFNEETVIAGLFREAIAPGAFAAAVKDDDVRALFNHDSNIVLGRTKSGTLTLREDDKGLFYDVNPPNTQAANDVRELIQRGDVSGSSFGFTVEDETWDDSEVKRGKLPLRIIRKASLFDVSPVTFPAYEATSVSARSKSKAEAVTEAEAARVAALEATKPADVKAREAMRAALDTAKAWRT
jgi:HK97 family phage prohead protease